MLLRSPIAQAAQVRQGQMDAGCWVQGAEHPLPAVPQVRTPVLLCVGARDRRVSPTQALELYRLLALGVALWSQLAIPLLFLVFWLVLFFLRLSSFLAFSASPLAQQGLLFLLLSR